MLQMLETTDEAPGAACYLPQSLNRAAPEMMPGPSPAQQPWLHISQVWRLIVDAIQNLMTSESKEKPIVELLDRHLATAIDLQLRIRNALWNADSHRLADTLELSTAAAEIQQFCELVADRLHSLGATAQETSKEPKLGHFSIPYPAAIADEQ
jgi:hypothetical protein